MLTKLTELTQLSKKMMVDEDFETREMCNMYWLLLGNIRIFISVR